MCSVAVAYHSCMAPCIAHRLLVSGALFCMQDGTALLATRSADVTVFGDPPNHGHAVQSVCDMLSFTRQTLPTG